MRRFYEKKRVNLDRVITLGKNEYDLPEYLILESAKRLYTRILNGQEVADVSLIHLIIADAKKLKRNEKDIGLETVYELIKVVESMVEDATINIKKINNYVQENIETVDKYMDSRLTISDEYMTGRMNTIDEWTRAVLREVRMVGKSIDEVNEREAKGKGIRAINKNIAEIKYTLSKQQHAITKIDDYIKKTRWQKFKEFF